MTPGLVLARAMIPRFWLLARAMGLGPWARARPTRVPGMMNAPVILPRIILTRFLAASWLVPDTPDGKVCGCRPGVPFTPPYVVCPYTAMARGSCLIRRRHFATLPVRRLAGMGATVGCLLPPRSGMGLCPTRCTGSVGTVVTVKCSAFAPLGRGRTGAFRLLALVTRLEATPRPHRTGGVPMPRRGPPGLPVGFCTSAGRPMVLSLPLMAISSRGTSMKPSTRCGACARTLSG